MLTDSELQNFYRLLESGDPTTVQLALDMATGMGFDWGEVDYHAWHHLIEESKLLSRGYKEMLSEVSAVHHDIHYVLSYIHQQMFFSIFIESETQILPKHSHRFINLHKLKINSNGALSPVLQDRYLLERIYELNLKEQNLSAVPEKLCAFERVQKLDFSHNQLTEIPDFIGDFTRLRSLHLQFNQLTELPASIAQLQNLSTLWIAKNRFTRLPEWLPELQNLRMCYVFDNPWAAGEVAAMQQRMPWCMFFDR